jgi:hypothetical protein
MSQTLKRTLIQSIRLMDYDFMCLHNSVQGVGEAEISRIETLGLSIERLRSILEEIPAREYADRGRMHDIRTQLSIVSTRTQLLNFKCKEKLGSTSISYLGKILAECENINRWLETHRDPEGAGVYT